ncbi:D-amino acid dehydrogenase [Oxalobacteraceae bacterium R-40]|uniref:D-amino acid dehydrogenase n=1 Tax=Keguizhuia sedimenti TaxID=3064264 RepID=A0ABU1BNL3_9BURK|nr:D-amino acid dehydrogenase [Oxalobacteraceae bacterium R-40]
MQVAVIGGGVIGVCTAYFLAAAGHEVVVLERYGNVAQETSFGDSGIVSPGNTLPWAMPGMPKKLLSSLFKSESPVLLKNKLDPKLWRWVRQWLDECELDRFLLNGERMQRLALYSRQLLQQLREYHELQYEQTQGVMQLFRTQQDLRIAQPALDLLAESGIQHKLIEPDDARGIEPALASHTTLFAALHLPQDEAGNCPLFTRQLKNIAQAAGVEFHFNSTVEALKPDENGISFLIGDRIFHADAVVVAAGIDSLKLLEPLGIDLPVYPVKAYSGTATIRDFEQAPLAAVMDETYKVAITRLGSRIRVAGTAELGSPDMAMHETALRTLVKVGQDWFPGAANYNGSNFWCGIQPTLPDGPPLIGATPVRNLYINIGHGSCGWTMAAGSGKILSDLLSGAEPDIDLDGLSYWRYYRARGDLKAA